MLIRICLLLLCLMQPAFGQTDLPAGDRVRALVDNQEAFRARWRLLSEARTSVHVQYYIFDTGLYGTSLLGQLLHLAKSGVQVNLMIDKRGSGKLSGRDAMYLKALVAHGAKVTTYNPYSILRLTSVFGANHDKIFSIDGKQSIVGGRNISDNYFATGDMSFQDTDVLVKSEKVSENLAEAFVLEQKHKDNQVVTNDLTPSELVQAERELLKARLDMNNSEQGKQALSESFYSGTHETATKVLDSSSWVNESRINEIKTEFMQQIRDAKTEIILQNAYVVLSPDVIAELAAAGRRGVKTVLHTNSMRSSGGGFMPQILFEREWMRMNREIPNLKVYTAGNKTNHLHAKVFVFDGKTAIVGSYNLDQLSEKVNSEVAIKIDSPSIAERLRLGIMRKIQSEGIEYKREKVGGTEMFRGGEQINCSFLEKMSYGLIYPFAAILRPIL